MSQDCFCSLLSGTDDRFDEFEAKFDQSWSRLEEDWARSQQACREKDWLYLYSKGWDYDRILDLTAHTLAEPLTHSEEFELMFAEDPAVIAKLTWFARKVGLPQSRLHSLVVDSTDDELEELMRKFDNVWPSLEEEYYRSKDCSAKPTINSQRKVHRKRHGTRLRSKLRGVAQRYYKPSTFPTRAKTSSEMNAAEAVTSQVLTDTNAPSVTTNAEEAAKLQRNTSIIDSTSGSTPTASTLHYHGLIASSMPQLLTDSPSNPGAQPRSSEQQHFIRATLDSSPISVTILRSQRLYRYPRPPRTRLARESMSSQHGRRRLPRRETIPQQLFAYMIRPYLKRPLTRHYPTRYTAVPSSTTRRRKSARATSLAS